MDVLERNNVKVIGQGDQAMIFGHGFGCDQNVWRYITPGFLATHRVVLYDHVGAGDSNLAAYSPVKYSQLEGYADDLLEICRRLNLTNSIFVGHSVGAMIGMLAAMQEPDRFAQLVLITPSPCYINGPGYVGGFERQDLEELLALMDADYLYWAQTVAPLIMGNPEEPSLGAELAESFCRTNPDIARQFARVTFLSDNRSDLPRLRTPSLIMQCHSDMIAPPEVGEYLRQNLHDATLVTLSASGHCPNLSAPLETVAAIEQYLMAS
ncbi:alpha/beta hydrolase [Hymenobacter koreensis]|uniref:Alpha/beta hydrolase n=1 Tax=Hymenobacter koreensis TaxID=1084523 RepID=A0ABP8IZH7_9BACT